MPRLIPTYFDSSPTAADLSKLQTGRLVKIPRQGRAGWCDDSQGIFCMLFNALQGTTEAGGGASNGEGKVNKTTSVPIISDARRFWAKIPEKYEK